MRLSRGCYLVVGLLSIVLAAPTPAQPPAGAGAPAAVGLLQPQGKVLQDAWDIAYLNGRRAGYVRLLVEEMTAKNGGKFLRASREMKLTVRRFNDIAPVQVVAGTDELPTGQVLGTFMVQGLGKQISQRVRGVVKESKLELTAEGQQGNFVKTLPWNNRIVGTYGELNLLRKRQPPPKPGDRFDYLIFEPIVNAIVTVRVTVEAIEVVSISGESPRLLRVSAVPDMIGDVQLPGQMIWFDANYEIRRSATRMPGMGHLVMERAKQQADAVADIPRHLLPSISDEQAIFLQQRIDQPHESSAVTYRLTMKDREPLKTFARDTRQELKAGPNGTVDLTVRAVRTPPAAAPAGDKGPGAEFAESNFFITSDDDRVKQHARAATGAEKDPWRKAQLIEGWVNRNMKALNFTEAMAPAAHVAKSMEGDCTEYAMLTAAMCRAAGVPSRTAIGLVYVDGPQRPFLGFHMWTEVYVRGAWVAIDATLGQGSVGPAHLKICDHSWHDTRAMTPLLPIMRVMLAEPSAEVAAVAK